ncbi:histone deacetylase domain-containing protein [Ditylenchus destructor]|nr:histone deacetylase domain-containing protein [Ditylenchus destructor]
MSGNRRVCYIYDDEFATYSYNGSHGMQPVRVRIIDELLQNYGIKSKLAQYRPMLASTNHMMQFHCENYTKALENIEKTNRQHISCAEWDLGTVDNPVFKGIFRYSQLSCGGSLCAARLINLNKTEIAINWMGGLHHAKKERASGFCYTNDIVLCILELLNVYARVLYIDIDIHHGDGVEEAFYKTDRVLTCSFHKYENDEKKPIFFPGTGKLADVGYGKGKHYALNVPLKAGITDEKFVDIFKCVTNETIFRYQPMAIVLQCGADSLVDDPLAFGCFNVTTEGHGRCVEHIKNFRIPLVMLGGGGYKITNVVRCWTYETAIAVGQEIEDTLPANAYSQYFPEGDQLHTAPSNIKDMNSSKYLNGIRVAVMETLRQMPPTPGIQLHAYDRDTSEGYGIDTTLLEEISGLFIFSEEDLKKDATECYTR